VQSATTIKRSLNYKVASEQVQTTHDLLHEYRLDREISTSPQDDRLERPKYGQALNLSLYKRANGNILKLSNNKHGIDMAPCSHSMYTNFT
jgi:hypothetical protein